MKENQADAIMTGRDGATTHVWIGNTYMPAIILGALVCVRMYLCGRHSRAMLPLRS